MKKKQENGENESGKEWARWEEQKTACVVENSTWEEKNPAWEEKNPAWEEKNPASHVGFSSWGAGERLAPVVLSRGNN